MKIFSVIAVYTFVLLLSLPLLAQDTESAVDEHRISVSEYRNKMMAGWIGQMVGVGWGAPTEFRYLSKIIPSDEVPEWKPGIVNVYDQDDLYVEMTFLRSMEVYGFDVSINQAGIDFANSAYNLWVANKTGRDNLRQGIAPPNAGHPAYNVNADAIDYQIEADFSGLIGPGLPNTVIALGEKFGRMMNYGDGLYGGQFVGAMYAEAFFEGDPAGIVEAGLKAIPAGSQYAETVRDVIQWHGEKPDDWETTWELINKKYHENPDYRRFTTPGVGEKFNIDAKLNGAYIVMGLLYGEGDLDQTIIISMRCGQDSDCNPSNAAGVLFTTMGYDKLPERFTAGLDKETKFSFTEYTFPALIDVSEKLAREAVTRAGGRIELNEDGEEVFVIPVSEIVPSTLEQSWEPGPLSENTFSDKELSQIEGHWIFNFSLLILVLLAFVLLKENRNFKSLLVLIPLLMLVIILELVKLTLSPGFYDSNNFISVFESLAVGLAIMLLFGLRLPAKKWYISIGVTIGSLAVVGIAGVMGAFDGRYVAGTEATLNTYAIQAVVWFLAMLLTVIFCKKNYTRVKFNLFAILTFFIIHLIGMYLITLAMAATNEAKASLAGNIKWILIGAAGLTIVHYLITVPYLILAYRSTDFDKRLLNWLGQS